MRDSTCTDSSRQHACSRLQAASCWGVIGVPSTDVDAHRLYSLALGCLNTGHDVTLPSLLSRGTERREWGLNKMLLEMFSERAIGVSQRQNRLL
jgi:hypothetical protein